MQVDASTSAAPAEVAREPAGDELVDRATGAVRVAAFAGPIARPNLEDARFPHALSGLAGRRLFGRIEALYRRRLRLKTWQYMSIVSPRWFVAVAVADAGFAGNGFVYAIDRESGAVHRRFVIRPLAIGATVASTSADSQHRFRARHLAIQVDNREGGRLIDLQLDGRFAGSGGRFAGAGPAPVKRRATSTSGCACRCRPVGGTTRTSSARSARAGRSSWAMRAPSSTRRPRSPPSTTRRWRRSATPSGAGWRRAACRGRGRWSASTWSTRPRTRRSRRTAPVTRAGRALELDDVFGIAEDNDTWW
jgi:hypothetical protein